MVLLPAIVLWPIIATVATADDVTSRDCRDQLFKPIFASEGGIRQLGLDVDRFNGHFDTYFACHSQAIGANPQAPEHMQIIEAAAILTKPSTKAVIKARLNSCIEPAHARPEYEACAEAYRAEYTAYGDSPSTEAWCQLIKAVGDFFACVVPAYVAECSLQEKRKIELFPVGITLLIRSVCTSCATPTFGCVPATQEECRLDFLYNLFVVPSPNRGILTILAEFDGNASPYCANTEAFGHCLDVAAGTLDESSRIVRDAADALCSPPFTSKVKQQKVVDCLEAVQETDALRACMAPYEAARQRVLADPSRYCEIIPKAVDNLLHGCVQEIIETACPKLLKFLEPFSTNMVTMAGGICEG